MYDPKFIKKVTLNYIKEQFSFLTDVEIANLMKQLSEELKDEAKT